VVASLGLVFFDYITKNRDDKQKITDIHHLSKQRKKKKRHRGWDDA
jgi:hypothetical protein